ncbi:MAG: hypothetical protein ABIP89_13525 [Polyangiaceae bacterium]
MPAPLIALTFAASLVKCQVYDASLLEVSEAGPQTGGGIGFWSKPGASGCFSAAFPKAEDRPAPQPGDSLPPIYLAIRSMRLGGLDPEVMPSKTAWQDIGFDLDNTCTTSGTCPSDPSKPSLSCKPTGSAVAFDGNYCRDNTFGRLEILASTIPEIGGKYGLNDDAFNCALCVGAYNFIIKISNYNGTANDEAVRVDAYPSPGLDPILPWNCATADWKIHPCFTADLPLTVQDTAVTEQRGGPDLPDAVLNSDTAYVRDGYLVMILPPDSLLVFPGRKALATAFPVKFSRGIFTGHLGRARDGTWAIDDGNIGGTTSEVETLKSFREIGFCESDGNFMLMSTFLHDNLDILASGESDPNATCDSISIGLGFTAAQATAGKLVHVDPLVECPGGDAGIKDAGGN